MKALIVYHLTTALYYGRVQKKLSDAIRKELVERVMEIVTTTVDFDFVEMVVDKLKKEETAAKAVKANRGSSKGAKTEGVAAESNKANATDVNPTRVGANEENATEGNTSEANSEDAKAEDADAKNANATEPSAKDAEPKEEPAKKEDSGITMGEPPAGAKEASKVSRSKAKEKPAGQGDLFGAKTP
ncbi:MAG: hypothetical protein IAE82_00870 [Opitutaceae bacterium]|nr:hypothetical protein [Opitutaceae bacterium]